MEMIRSGSVGVKGNIGRIGYDDDCEEFDVPADEEWDEKGRIMISHIYVWFDKIIRSIQFGYVENGAPVLSTKYGPSTPSEGCSFRVVRLDQDEFVTGLSGSLGHCNGTIKILTFRTNREVHGPIGLPDIRPGVPMIEIDPAIRVRREFGGFFGSFSIACLSSIGIYVNPMGY